MRAIPVCYPVTLHADSIRESLPQPYGVLSELVTFGENRMLESGGQRVQLQVLARTEADARRRAASAVPGGQIVEVGSPTPLQHFASQKALPYRRSFVYGRTKNGRFNVQGGQPGSVKASPPLNPATQKAPATGVGMSVGEAVDRLLGSSLDEATPQQRLARERRRKQWRAKNPALARKLALNAKRTAAKRANKAKTKRKQSMRRANRFRGRFDPNYESQYTQSQGRSMTESVDQAAVSQVIRGFPIAMQVHEHLKSIPPEWFQSSRGRATVVKAIDLVRMQEGNEPADALEDAYLYGVRLPCDVQEDIERAAKTTPHRVVVRFESERSRDFAVRKIQHYMEECSCACDCADSDDYADDNEADAEFTVEARTYEEACDRLSSKLSHINLRQHTIL